MRLGIAARAVTQGGQGVGAYVRDAAVIRFKPGGVAEDGPVEAAVVPFAVTHGDLWRPVIGWSDGGADILLRLPALHQTNHREAIPAPGKNPGSRKNPLCQSDLGSHGSSATEVAFGEITPVAVVADLIDGQRDADAAHCRDPAVHAAVVLSHQSPPALVAQGVLRQPVQANLTVVHVLQIAELAFHADTPSAHGPGDQRGIAVGCDVPVEGLHVVDAADRVDRHHRGQQTGGSPPLHRELHIGQARRTQALELDLHIFGQPYALGRVGADPAGLHEPFGQPFGPRGHTASGVPGLLNRHPIFVDEVDLPRIAMTALNQSIAGRIETALKTVKLQLSTWALETVALAVDAHTALGLHPLACLVVLQSVGAHRHAGPAQQHIPFELGIHVGPHADALRIEVHGALAAFGRRQLLLQSWAAAQHNPLRLRPAQARPHAQQQEPGGRQATKNRTGVQRQSEQERERAGGPDARRALNRMDYP